MTSQKFCGQAHSRSVLVAGAADILISDIAAVGGILDLLDFTELADLQGVQISPHFWHSMTVAATVMLHVCALIPNAKMAEIIPHGKKFALKAFYPKGEYARLSYKSRIGIDLNILALHYLCDDHQSNCLNLVEATC